MRTPSRSDLLTGAQSAGAANHQRAGDAKSGDTNQHIIIILYSISFHCIIIITY